MATETKQIKTYIVIAGKAYFQGKLYKAGEQIKTDVDLQAKFPNKFETATVIIEKETKQAPTPEVKDVTKDFPEAKAVKVKIFETAEGYNVTDEKDTKTILNKTPLSKDEVAAFIKKNF